MSRPYPMPGSPMCPGSKQQFCRMMCPRKRCGKGQCLMRTDSCCKLKCQSLKPKCPSAKDICAGKAKCVAKCPCPKCLPPPPPKKSCEKYSGSCFLCVLKGCVFQDVPLLRGRRELTSPYGPMPYKPIPRPKAKCFEPPMLRGRRELTSMPYKPMPYKPMPYKPKPKPRPDFSVCRRKPYFFG